ncbi:30S ribosomal protein S8 [Patescibacteria group bacterium]|nr:30S ribosomal protein S8 [Patescibacteria group bacterium]MCG2702439.1 30S ribosomal protein S8 [Candidatus Parcubacteria bacterium]MBU4264511.1 30S ribosomal protein S8 [Patescibacteria group bacterium]MBU4390442.1 30S ribosomal protein S8 [Patescibacteria group bacterium]MBU4397358.1 30S ribosomal protein S8 [Patescibacteria group bacterium]
MHSSPILDFLVRIKNAYAVGKKTIKSPSSKTRESIAKLMVKHSYLDNFSVEGKTKKIITLKLSYNDKEPSFTNLKIFSKPGRRIYSPVSSLPWGKTKNSLIIVSTSTGIISHKEAKKQNVGGEIIAEIW